IGDDFGRVDNGVSLAVVGKVEEPLNEGDVGLLRQLGPLLTGAKGTFYDKASFSSHRYDKGILHHLSLHQPEDLRAKIIRAIRPTKPSAGHAPTAQVNPFH